MIKFGQVQAYDKTTGEATIVYMRPDACAKCGACGGGGKSRSIRLKADCAVGDWVKVELPDAAQPITIAANTSIAMKGGPWFHYDLTDEEREAFPDGTFNITAIRIEPLAVSIVGGDYESEPQNLSRYNVQDRVKLYRADGSEITYGWDGNFFQGQYSPTVLRVDSYDIIDPEAVAYVEIDGERFDVKQ